MHGHVDLIAKVIFYIEMKLTKILNCNIQCIIQQELLEKLNEGVVVTPNVDHLIKMQRDKDFYDIINKAEWCVCDSKILLLLSKLLKHPLPEAIPGSSFFTAFYEFHQNDPDCKIFLLGAREGVPSRRWSVSTAAWEERLLSVPILPHLVLRRNQRNVRTLSELSMKVVLMLCLLVLARLSRRSG